MFRRIFYNLKFYIVWLHQGCLISLGLFSIFISDPCLGRFTQNLSVFRRDINDSLKGPNVTTAMSVNEMMTSWEKKNDTILYWTTSTSCVCLCVNSSSINRRRGRRQKGLGTVECAAVMSIIFIWSIFFSFVVIVSISCHNVRADDGSFDHKSL